MKINFKSIVALASAMLIGGVMTSCGGGSFRIEDEESPIASVNDGNTVVLEDGLTVHLLGVSPNNAFTKQELERLIGQNIALHPDSQGDEEFYSYDDEVWAYAMLTEKGIALNRKLLTTGGQKAFDTQFLTDSLEAYRKIVEKPDRKEFTDTELAAKLKSSSMMIVRDMGGGLSFGTGFFINENGLAVTNNHVMPEDGAYSIFLSDANGKLNEAKVYRMQRIVATSDFRTSPDFTVFYVDLDEDSKKNLSYLTVSQTPVSAGDRIATVGNPVPGNSLESLMPMVFAKGAVSGVEIGRPWLFSIDVATDHGFSGGPLVNEYGEVVGITTSGYDQANGNLNFGTDIKFVRERLDDLKLPYAGK